MKSTVWLRDRSRDDLDFILSVLNGEWPQRMPHAPKVLPPAILGTKPELRRLVELWLGVDRKVDRLIELEASIGQRLRRMTAQIAIKNGALKLEWPLLETPQRRELPTENEQWQDFAFQHFVNLLLNPHAERLAG